MKKIEESFIYNDFFGLFSLFLTSDKSSEKRENKGKLYVQMHPLCYNSSKFPVYVIRRLRESAFPIIEWKRGAQSLKIIENAKDLTPKKKRDLQYDTEK